MPRHVSVDRRVAVPRVAASLPIEETLYLCTCAQGNGNGYSIPRIILLHHSLSS